MSPEEEVEAVWALRFLFAAVSLIVLSIVGRVARDAIRNLRQALVMYGAPGRLDPSAAGRVAVHGRVVMQGPYLMRTGITNALWLRVEHYESVSDEDGSGWHLVDSDTGFARFSLDVGGREIAVPDCPTEVHGGRSKTVYPDKGCLPIPVMPGRKYVVRWLPESERLTIVGKLWDAGTHLAIGEDGALGMLVTRHSPRVAATLESLKGLAGAALVLGLAAGAVVATMRSPDLADTLRVIFGLDG